jgi:tRNA1Val (adenine37-N6)-methyltransferase
MDIKKAADVYGTAVFDVVTANPPYLNAGEINECAEIAMARHEITCTLTDIAEVSAKLLRFGGRLYMVHRVYRLADIVCDLRNAGIEPKRLKFLECGLVLVEAVRGGKPWVRVEWEKNQ